MKSDKIFEDLLSMTEESNQNQQPEGEKPNGDNIPFSIKEYPFIPMDITANLVQQPENLNPQDDFEDEDPQPPEDNPSIPSGYKTPDYETPTTIVAIWVETTVPDHMLFYKKPFGKVIKPKPKTYYPPPQIVVYDKEGKPFISIFPKAKTYEQENAQTTQQFEKDILKPLDKGFRKFGKVLSKEIRKIQEQLK